MDPFVVQDVPEEELDQSEQDEEKDDVDSLESLLEPSPSTEMDAETADEDSTSQPVASHGG